MSRLTCLVLLSILVTGCVSTQDASYKSDTGKTTAACMNNCIERTGNAEACSKFAKDARESCGDLIAKVCAAEKSGKCGS